jgi:MFS family permease
MSLAGAAAVLLVYPLVQGRELGWPLWTLAMLAAAVPVLGAFARHQVRRKQVGSTPLIEPSVFRNRSYVSGAGFAMVFLGSMGGLTLALTGLMQLGLGYSAIEASLTSAPYALGGFVGSAIGGMTMGRLGRAVLHAGLAIKAVGVVALYVVLELAGTGVGHWHFTAPLLVAGIGMGMVFVPLFDIVLAGVADHEVGSASGVLQALQQLGMTLGVASLGTLFFGLLGSQVDRAADFVAAAGPTILVTVALLAAAFAIGFLLPKHAREHAV